VNDKGRKVQAHETGFPPTQANDNSRYDRIDDRLLRDNRSPRFGDGSGDLQPRRIPPDDNGKISGLEAIGAGSDVRARDQIGAGAMAQTCHRKCEAATA
jgi:hypothetical protein